MSSKTSGSSSGRVPRITLRCPAHARQKAAEDGASVAQRRRREAERDARELCAANEELHRQLKKAYDHAAELEDLNERVKRAQGVADLIGVRS